MRIYYSLIFLISSLGFSQVGIGTSEPKATLDIVSTITNESKDGVLFPKLTKQQLQNKALGTYGSNQNGTVVYVTDVNSNTTGPSLNQVEAVTSTGYYYYNSTTSKWMPLTYFQDLRIVGTNNHITSDGGFNAAGTSAGTGSNNIGIGNSSLKSIESGTNLIAIGNNSLADNINSSGAIGIGYYALSKFTGNESSVAVGYNALANNVTGLYNTAVGNAALKNVTSANNTALGYNTLTNLSSGTQNTAVGTGSFISLTTGTGNVGLGYRTGYNVKTGSHNTLIGNFTGSYVGGTVDNANQIFTGNTLIGGSIIHSNNNTGYHRNTNYTNNVVLGYANLSSTLQETLKNISNITLLGQNINVEENLPIAEISYATAIGSGARIFQSNSIVLGRPNDFVSIGHNRPTNGLHIKSSGTSLDPVRIEGIRTTTASYEYVVIDNDGVLKKVPGPASRTNENLNLKTNNTEKQIFQFNYVTIPVNVNSTMQNFNIYNIYSAKIDKSISSSGAKKLDKINKTNLEYHITDYDNELITDLSINDEGILTYRLLNSGDNNIKINVLIREK